MATVNNDTTATMLRAFRANSTNLSLDNSKLSSLPVSLAKFVSLKSFSAKNNQLTNNDSILVLQSFKQLVTLNLGGNSLVNLPQCLPYLCNLTVLHLFNNSISAIDSDILEALAQLVTLNLNFNQIEDIPSSIKCLQKLKVLSLANNKLTYLPKEICQLINLIELHLEGNEIKKIPYEIFELRKLQKLFIQKNKIYRIPQSIGDCASLRLLDVSSNLIEIFPSELRQLKLHQFHYELNPLLPFIPVPSDLIEEVLSLKELLSRKLIKLLENDRQLESMVHANAEVKQCLSHVGSCAICEGPFINSWLDCVEFVSTKNLFKIQGQNGVIPLRIILCSYKCFNSKDHRYYGIAIPPEIRQQ